MRKILLTIFSSAFIFIGPTIACPVEEEDKNKIPWVNVAKDHYLQDCKTCADYGK